MRGDPVHGGVDQNRGGSDPVRCASDRIRKTLRAVLSFIPAAVMIYIIFIMSAQDGAASSGLSLKVSRLFVQAANTLTGGRWDAGQTAIYTEMIHHLVRKAAHVTEYLVLAVTVTVPMHRTCRMLGVKLFLVSLAVCVILAALDEWHQTFIPDRTGTWRDVLVDGIGFVAGTAGTALIIGKVSFRKKRVRKMDQIERITYYEQLLDRLLQGDRSEAVIEELEAYYGSEAWRQDLADDEAGKLPKDLKRGVLSEDGIWNALYD